jgi:hypothetical protein
MAVPARPVEGAPVDTAWGQVAHDTAVAMDIQVGGGTLTFPNANQATATITFPRPFAAGSTPTVIPLVGPHGLGGAVLMHAQTSSTSATSFGLRLVSSTGSASSQANVPYSWIAYGPRA